MSKIFVPALCHPETTEKSPFEATWPQFQSKHYTSSVHQYLKELEEKILRQVKEKSLLIEKEAYEKGFAQGEKDGLELGRKRLETMVHQFEQVLLDIRRQREALYKEFEREMLELVFSISKKVIHHELTLQEGLVQKTLEEAFQNVVDRKRIIVHLHPADYQFLLNHSDRFPFIRGQTEGIRVVEDPSISRGGCLLETSFGEVDATIEGQFAEIVSSIWSQWASQERETEKSTP